MKNITLLLFVLFPQFIHAFPMDRVQNRIHAVTRANHHPVAVFDLDETLIHSAKRMTESYIHAIERNRSLLDANFPNQTEKAYQSFLYSGERLLRTLPNQYDTVNLFKNMGITDPHFVKQLADITLPIYLSNEFISLDSANEGAVGLLRQIYQARGRVYFVTSRYKDTQEAETLRNLQSTHLYLNGQQSTLFLRDRGETSLDFKKRAYSIIQSQITAYEEVMMVGENEPENFNALMETFPTALGIFVTGAILNTSVSINQNAETLFTKNFVRSAGPLLPIKSPNVSGRASSN